MKKRFLLLVLVLFTLLAKSYGASYKRFYGYHDYAVIINSGGDMYKNYERYWNNCSSIYKLLVNDYGYPKDHVYVIMSDGSSSGNDRLLIGGGYGSSPLDLDGDGVADIQYSATKSNISAVFNTLQNKITSQDNLFVYTTGPGRRSGGISYLTLWNNVDFSPSELNTELNKLSAHVINILMQQDYCGGFSNTILSSNRTVTTACSATTQAKVLSGSSYNTYTYLWTKAASTEESDDEGDSEDEDKTIEELAEEVAEIDLNDSGGGFMGGSSVPVNDNYISQIYISGPNQLCSAGVYTTREPTALETIQWSIQNDRLSITSGQNSQAVTISKLNNGMCEIYLTFNIPNVTSKTIKKVVSVGPPPENIGTGLSAISPYGATGYWSSSDSGNKFSITGSGDYSNLYRIDAYIYRLNDSFYPSELVWNKKFYGRTNVGVPSFSAGWYLLKVRGYNDCGYSEWLEQEVEMVDHSLGFLLEYDSASGVLTLTMNGPSSLNSVQNAANIQSGSSSNYEIQIWNGMSMVRSYKTDLSRYQVSLTGLPDGIYIVRVIKDGQTFSRKFIKR